MEAQQITRERCAPIERLNAECQCATLDRGQLHIDLTGTRDQPERWSGLLEPRPHLFSDTSVFVSRSDMAAMQATVTAIEAVVALPAYRAWLAQRSPAIAHADPGPRGAFMGYDFHLGRQGPQLIEVNTNAGGAFLNAALAGAHTACCGNADLPHAGGTFAERVVAMFRREWALQGRTTELRRIAIVDDTPKQQYLFPEFLLAQRVLQDAGIAADIADAADLESRDGALWHDGNRVDLVYNRLVDFTLADPRHVALRQAYEGGTVVLTPNPHVHAVLADKRNLTFLSDPDRVRGAGLGAEHVATLQLHVPATVEVAAERADALWAARNKLFFKPASGYGSKAVYRGDKLTRAAWAGILAGEYVAQQFVPPSERTVTTDGALHARKTDVRLYTYDGQVLLAAARIYQGQTTNFRTVGGGFAPVVVVGEPVPA